MKPDEERAVLERAAKVIEEGAKLSFALFISHALTGMIWFGALQALEARFNLPIVAQWCLWAGSIPAALFVAVVFHRWVDTPVQRWLAQRLKRRQTATA